MSSCETDTGATDDLHCPTEQGPLRSTIESEASDEDYETGVLPETLYIVSQVDLQIPFRSRRFLSP